MAAITNIHVPAGPGGATLERESLARLVEAVYREETPLYSNFRKGKNVIAIKEEWGTEDIGSISAPTAQSHGFSNGSVSVALTLVRLDNYCEVTKIDGGVSHSMEGIEAAGDTNKMAHQKMVKGRKLRRQINKLHHTPQIKDSADPPKVGTIKTYVPTVQYKGVAGTPGTAPTGNGLTLPTQGTTPDDFDTITPLDETLEACTPHSGRPDTMILSPRMKRFFSRLPDASVAENRVNTTAGKGAGAFKHIGAVDWYLSDFGELECIVDIDAPNTDILGGNFDDAEIRKIAGMDFHDFMLAKTGSGDEFVIENAETLAVINPYGFFYINGYQT